jgi:hypothetical protein
LLGNTGRNFFTEDSQDVGWCIGIAGNEIAIVLKQGSEFSNNVGRQQ